MTESIPRDREGGVITRKAVYACMLSLAVVLCACSPAKQGARDTERIPSVESEGSKTEEPDMRESEAGIQTEEESESESKPEESESESESESETKEPESESETKEPESESETKEPESGSEASAVITGGHMVAIDAGHQRYGNYDKEPVGPGAGEKKAKVSDGTQGVVTRLNEYELNLAVAKKLRDELEARGYQVYMVRETDDVDISNMERAQAARDSGAEIFVRIHANGSDDSSAQGAFTICPTSGNPYISEMYSDCRQLAEKVLDGLAASTGCKKRSVWETDTMSGINWSQIPVTIIEMGYMSNPDEDRKLATDEYQALIAAGIADGIDAYYGSR